MEKMRFDEEFRKLGAVSVYDEPYPTGRQWWDARPGTVRTFARYYFNAEGTEIGYCIPDLQAFANVPHVHEKPRVWGMPHTLVPMPPPPEREYCTRCGEDVNDVPSGYRHGCGKTEKI